MVQAKAIYCFRRRRPADCHLLGKMHLQVKQPEIMHDGSVSAYLLKA